MNAPLLYERVFGQKFNPNHDPQSGEFSSGEGSIADPVMPIEGNRAFVSYAADAIKAHGEAVDLTTASEGDAVRSFGDLRVGDKLSNYDMGEKAGFYLQKIEADKRGEIASAIAAASQGGTTPEKAQQTISSWNYTSRDLNGTMLNEAARQMYNLPSTPVHDSRLRDETRGFPPSDMQSELDDAKGFLAGQYAYTQAALARAGYAPTDLIDMYRGFSRSPEEREPALTAAPTDAWSDATITTRPLSSWTASAALATSFGPLDDENAQAYVIHAQVPVSDIVSTGYTGLGVPGEMEYIVKGGPKQVRLIAGAPGRGVSIPRKTWSAKFNQNHDPQNGEFSSGSIEGLPAGVEIAPGQRAQQWAATGRYNVSAVKNESSYGDASHTLTYEPRLTDGVQKLTGKWGDTVFVDANLATTSAPIIPGMPPEVQPKDPLPDGYQRDMPSMVTGPNIVYRGISQDELDSIKTTGQIKSKGSGNWTDAEGTAFTTDAQRARVYAGGFAAPQDLPTFAKPGYIIAVDLPEGTPLVDVHALFGAQADERQIAGALPASAIRDIVQLQPYRMTPGTVELRSGRDQMNYDQAARYFDGSSNAPSVSYVFRRVAPPSSKSLVARYEGVLGVKFNQNHDERGRFASDPGGASGHPVTPSDFNAARDAATVTDFATRSYQRAGQDPAGRDLSYGGLAYDLDLSGLNATRGQEIIDASHGTVDKSDLSRWARAWGKDSGGRDWAALQAAASRVFGTPLGTAAPRIAALHPSEADIQAAEPFVRATYAATQQYLADNNIGSVNLYRGVGYTDEAAPPTYQAAMASAIGEAIGDVPTKPLASYGADESVTQQFGSNFQGLNPSLGPGGRPYTLAVTVPRERIIGTSYAGIGVPREGEYVVVGGPTTARVRTRRSRW